MNALEVVGQRSLDDLFFTLWTMNQMDYLELLMFRYQYLLHAHQMYLEAEVLVASGASLSQAQSNSSSTNATTNATRTSAGSAKRRLWKAFGANPRGKGGGQKAKQITGRSSSAKGANGTREESDPAAATEHQQNVSNSTVPAGGEDSSSTEDEFEPPYAPPLHMRHLFNSTGRLDPLVFSSTTTTSTTAAPSSSVGADHDKKNSTAPTTPLSVADVFRATRHLQSFFISHAVQSALDKFETWRPHITRPQEF